MKHKNLDTTLAPFLSALLTLALPACSGGGGGGGDEVITVTSSESAFFVDDYEGSALRADIAATLDDEPIEVTWVLVGPGSLVPLEGPTTTYTAPYTLSEDITATIFAVAKKGEGSVDIALTYPRRGELFVQFENYNQALYLELAGPMPFNPIAFESGPTQPELVNVGFYDIAPNQAVDISWDTGIAGFYTPVGDGPVEVTEAAPATINVRWDDQGTGFLWSADFNAGLAGLSASDLHGYTTDGTRVIAPGALRQFGSVEADESRGRLWAGDTGLDSIMGYLPAELGAAAVNLEGGVVLLPTAVVGNTASIATVADLWYDDGTDRLWFVNGANGTFGAFDATVLDSTGASSPLPEFLQCRGLRVNPVAIAVSPANGAVFIADDATDAIERFDLATLPAGFDCTTLPGSTMTGPFVDVTSMAFDVEGNLWVAQSGELLQISAADIAQAGDVTVVETVALSGASITTPRGLVFDPSGTLWFVDDGLDSVTFVDPSLLTMSNANVDFLETRALENAPRDATILNAIPE